MGNCCYCRPQTLVTEDPDVSIFTDVGFSITMSPNNFFDSCQYYGMVYVKSRNLYLEATAGRRFCCLCCRDRWSLSFITQVEVVTGNLTITRSDLDRYGVISRTTYSMNPGVRVTFKSGSRLVMQMENAENFCTQLRRLCNLPSPPTTKVALVLQAIVTGAVRKIQVPESALSKAEGVQPLLKTSEDQTLQE